MRKKHSVKLSDKDQVNTKPILKTTGMVHSFETFGALDGPGLRFVIFLEGCPLRCVYCHNRDMLDLKDYMKMTPQDLLKTVLDYKPYFGKNGGVTLSGGDPVFQPKFAKEFLKLCKKNKIHTAVDTSLYTTPAVIDELIPYTDLFMVSLKHFDSDVHTRLTGLPNERILENIRYLSNIIGKNGRKHLPKLWFRYVILPGYTDTRRNINALVRFLHEMNFELIDILPYHTYGVYKWKKLGLQYGLKSVNPPTQKSIQKITKRLEKEGVNFLLSD